MHFPITTTVTEWVSVLTVRIIQWVDLVDMGITDITHTVTIHMDTILTVHTMALEVDMVTIHTAMA